MVGGRRHVARLGAVLVLTVATLGAGPWVVAPALTAPSAPHTAPELVTVAAQVLQNAGPAEIEMLRPEWPPGFWTADARAAVLGEAARADAAASAAAVPAPRAISTPPAGTSSPIPADLPLRVDAGGSGQVVTVVAPSAGATTATLTAWQREPAGWTAVIGPVPARIGSAGVGQASESTARTPAGTFTVTEAFGRAGDPGTALPYRLVDRSDWWVSDVGSPLYNQHTRCAAGTCPFTEAAGENLYAAGAVYDHAVVIDYNRSGTPGAGSAFFLHVSNGAPTAGCVAIDRDGLSALLRWLDPAARPLIALGVG